MLHTEKLNQITVKSYSPDHKTEIHTVLLILKLGIYEHQADVL